MSRLYGRLQSDRRQTDATVGANENMSGTFTWGSANDPKLAVTVSLVWYKDMDFPTVYIDIPNDVKTVIQRHGTQVYGYSPK